MPSSKPVVRVIGTGGSIAGVGPDRMDFILYPEIGKHINIQQSLDRVPEIQDIADVKSEDLVSVGSTAIGATEWLGLARRINTIFREEPDVAGVAITHGTATLEETSYFLHLTVKSEKPVVITGAMRPPTALSTDADLNLLDAVRTAATPEAAGLGVLTVLNNEIQCGRDVTKASTFRVETFRPNELGFLGYADSDGKVEFYRAPIRRHTINTPFNVDAMNDLPRVDIIYSYAGDDGLLVDAVRNNKSDGLILAGFGGGTFPPAVIDAALKLVDDGIPVVLSTRSTSGRVVMTPKKSQQGFLVSDNLMPPKARILLMLGLTQTNVPSELQQFFYDF